MMNNAMMNKVMRTMMVAKINLGEDLPQELIELGLFPNTNDCFLLSKNTANRMEVSFRKPKEEELTYMRPDCGSKLIGSFRDKGSVTAIMDRYVPFVKYECKTELEADRLVKALEEMRGENCFYIQQKNIVLFEIDIIANPSTGRDNVSALVLQSCLELEGIFEDSIKEYTLKEIADMNVLEVVSRRKHEHEVLMFDMQSKQFVYSFGEVPILLEDFFWQPKHDNSLYCMEKEFSCTYAQFKDGLEVLIPHLYKALNDSLDYESIHEHCILLGMELKENNFSNQLIEENEQKFNNYSSEEDLL